MSHHAQRQSGAALDVGDVGREEAERLCYDPSTDCKVRTFEPLKEIVNRNSDRHRNNNTERNGEKGVDAHVTGQNKKRVAAASYKSLLSHRDHATIAGQQI